ncbi:MAG: thymidylate synthase [Acidobacteriia bacterium]|nr:thymidylate synthase [Terriglobia bacterium]
MTREIAHLTLVIAYPNPVDPIISRHGDPAWLNWIHKNFFVQNRVKDLGNAASYAVRLFNYGYRGRDQIQGIVKRLRRDRETRSATVTTFMPLTDTSYIPCISLLDFWIPGKKLELVVYAHSLDFGKKAYGNLVELAQLQSLVAKRLKVSVGRMTLYVKSAHIYKPEWKLMRQIGRHRML